MTQTLLFTRGTFKAHIFGTFVRSFARTMNTKTPKLANRLREETRIVKMVLSNMSISISSPFSSDLITTTNFRFIKAPRLEVSAETKAEEGKRRKVQVGQEIVLYYIRSFTQNRQQQ